MATKNQNTWEILYNGLATNEKNKPGGEEVLKKLNELHAIAQSGSNEDFQSHVSELLQTYGENYGLSANVNGQDLLREAVQWRDANFPNTNFAQSQSEFDQPPQQGAGVVGGFLEGLGDRHTAPSAGGGRTPDAATNAVQSLQEQELLKEFNDALERGDQDKIKRLFEDSEGPGKLDIHKLLADQLEKAHTHLDLLTPEELKLARLDGTTQARDKDGNLMFDEHGKPIMITKVQAMHNEFDRQAKLQEARLKKQEDRQLTLAEQEAKAKQEAQEKKWQEEALNGIDERNRKAAFQSLLQSRLNQAHSYSLFNEYYANEQDLALVPLFQLLGNQRQVLLRQRAAQAQQEEQHIEEGPSTQHTQATNAARQLRAASGRQGLKNAAKKALVKALDAGAKALGPEAVIVWAFIKKFWWVFALVFLLYLSVFIGVIVIIVSALSGQNNLQTSTPGVHPVAPSTEPIDLALDITTRFGIVMVGYDHTHLLWAWKKFYDVSGTKFIDLVRGKIVVQNIFAGSHVYCLLGRCEAFVSQYASEDTFDAILLHEIGHIIQWTQPSSVNHQTELPGIIVKEGYLTYYSRLNCLHVNQIYEDFAETLTYYLNPTVGQTTGCGHGPNPYTNGANPLHYNFAREILGAY